jgi:pimeloyl-ACP methyl ester carboxylesterase
VKEKDVQDTAVAPEELQIRVHNADARPTLVYLPGLHGDWTLIGGFREALGKRARFVEITYPRTLTWSLEDYAAGIENKLIETGINEAWLLGESFGSQVVWPMLSANRLRVQGVIFAGGFARHPMNWGVRLAERMAGAIPLWMLIRVLFGYARIARWRFRKSPRAVEAINQFIERRTKLDKQAAQHRLHLLTAADPCAIAQQTKLPIYAITGLFDPIVPWIFVRPWFRRNCSALREYRIIWNADHNVLGTAPGKAADFVAKWMRMGDIRKHSG